MARLAKSLDILRNQVDAAWPDRSKASDGWIGDAAHAKRKSDHNPDADGTVDALDITHDPVSGCDCGKISEAIRASKDHRVKYLIFDRRIVTPDTWEWRPYTGANPHKTHLHVSVNDEQQDDETAWTIGDITTVPDDTKFKRAVGPLFQREGGWNPDDPSNMGITLDTLSVDLGKRATLKDLKALTRDRAEAIYRKHYWNVIRGDRLPDGLDIALFDFAVHSGPHWTVSSIQKIVGAKQDGAMGPRTLEAINSKDVIPVINALMDARFARMKTLDNWQRHKSGWITRIDTVRTEALQAAERRTPTPPVPPDDETPAASTSLDDLTDALKKHLGAKELTIAVTR